MASQMIAEDAAQKKFYKIVIMVLEYFIVKSKFYDFYAMNKAGEGVSFDTPEFFEKLKENVEFVVQQYEGELLALRSIHFEALEFIVCRYHGYLPRVNEEVMLLRLKICTGKILPLPTTQAHIIIKIKKKKERHNGESF